MRLGHRLALLVFMALILVFTYPTLVAGQGCYPYNSSLPSSCLAIPYLEQHLWKTDASYFLNDYDPYGVPAYSAPSHNAPANNQSASYWLNEANVSYLTGSYEQAAESYAKAVNIDPSLKSGWLNLGNSLYFLGRYQASLNAYNSLLNLEPKNAEALAGRSLAMEAIERNNTSAVA